jgi:hypothetical protein
VGAGAALSFDAGGSIQIAYQDGATSDLWLATRGASGWSKSALHAGPDLHGFWISAVTAGDRSLLASYFYDRAIYPPGELIVTPIP